MRNKEKIESIKQEIEIIAQKRHKANLLSGGVQLDYKKISDLEAERRVARKEMIEKYSNTLSKNYI